MWLELPYRPEDINITWDNLSVKILIIAPSVSSRVLRLANRIEYPVSFLEIKKFSMDKDEFILTNQLEPEPKARSGVTRGQEVYDKDFYLANRDKSSVAKFFETIDIVDQVVKKKSWELEKKMNKGYVSYKYGFPIVFSVNWIGIKSFSLCFKLPKDKAESIEIPGLAPHRYEEEWKQVLYKIDKPVEDVKRLLPLFEAAFKHITGAEQ